MEADPRLGASYGSGWYGYGTKQVLLWRRDRITAVVAADLPKNAL
ncbi:hypothetical protein OOK31_36445 [Streptomyces sp. NBC_00249]|nr:hypothetical protein [Streptomyces sp. NBC_00249]